MQRCEIALVSDVFWFHLKIETDERIHQLTGRQEIPIVYTLNHPAFETLSVFSLQPSSQMRSRWVRTDFQSRTIPPRDNGLQDEDIVEKDWRLEGEGDSRTTRHAWKFFAVGMTSAKRSCLRSVQT